MKFYRKKDTLYFIFYDDFDYMKIQTIKEQWQYIIHRNLIKKVYFDFSNITFIDSTGIGFILARYRDLKKESIELILCNIKEEHKIIFEMSGLFKIIRYENYGVNI